MKPSTHKSKSSPALNLQQRAEKELRRRGSPPETEDMANRRLLHELQVHQVELEMQNTELQEARDRVESVLEKYTDLYDFAPVGYFTLSRDAIIRLVNLTGSQLVGIARGQLVGRPFGALVSMETRGAFSLFLKQVFADDARHTITFHLVGDAKAPRTVDIEAQRCSNDECRVVMLDVSARKQAEETMRVSELRYRRLFETAHDGVLLIDPATRKITDANPSITELLGYPRGQLVGKEMFEIGLLNDEAASQEFFRTLKRRREVRYDDLPMETGDGRQLEVEVVGNLYQEDNQSVIHCNIRDITERKRSELAERRLAVLAASNSKLIEEIARRQLVERSLTKSKQGQMKLLEQSHRLEGELRLLSRQVLQAQEDERKRISRELHDVIGQGLTGITLRLGLLKKESARKKAGIGPSIARTQKMVEKALSSIHQFARELRPSALDDLGLIPALHSYLKSFTAQTGVRTHLSVFNEAELLDIARRTVLFRVAQEALNNVAKHARASRVEVSIQKLPDCVCMSIKDNGSSFDALQLIQARPRKRLGLLGMRERVEILGGIFSIESAPGQGATILARLPLGKTPLAKPLSKPFPNEK